jgi:hypothetical protein
MAMPSFLGALDEAHAHGDRCLPCHWCGGWVWWPRENALTEETRKAGRVFHSWGECQRKEGEARSSK